MPTKAEISFVRSLADKRAREQSGLFVVEGPKMVAEAMASGWRVRNIYSIEDGVSPRDLERMSSLRTPQGVLAVVEMPLLYSERADEQGRLSPAAGGRRRASGFTSETALPDAKAEGLTLALDGIQDPGNLGTIMRTADWFGVGRIVCSPDCADRFNPKAVQASMGAIFRIPVTYSELIFPPDTPVYGAFLDGDSIYDTSFAPDAVILLGSEGRGISAAAAARVTHRITIPSFSPRAESLNVAAAAAIICSEVRGRTRV